MAKKNSEAALAAQKAKKQKILLIALAPVFLGLIVWQGPKTYNALMGGSPPPPLLVATPTPTVTGAVSTAAPGDLPESDPQPDLLDGQLLSFSRFSGRDPFVPPTQPGAGNDDPAANAEATTIEVNGTAENLSTGDSFPADDPTFRLVSVSTTSADIGLVSGAFSNGQETITINVGETLVLQADDGARYAIKLVSVATA